MKMHHLVKTETIDTLRKVAADIQDRAERVLDHFGCSPEDIERANSESMILVRYPERGTVELLVRDWAILRAWSALACVDEFLQQIDIDINPAILQILQGLKDIQGAEQEMQFEFANKWGEETGRSDTARNAAKAKHAKQPVQKAKLFVKECWVEWQADSSKYPSAAAFSRDMLEKMPSELTSEVVVTRWVRQWAKERE
jgi:hypothetical protein